MFNVQEFMPFAGAKRRLFSLNYLCMYFWLCWVITATLSLFVINANPLFMVASLVAEHLASQGTELQ